MHACMWVLVCMYVFTCKRVHTGTQCMCPHLCMYMIVCMHVYVNGCRQLKTGCHWWPTIHCELLIEQWFLQKIKYVDVCMRACMYACTFIHNSLQDIAWLKALSAEHWYKNPPTKVPSNKIWLGEVSFCKIKNWCSSDNFDMHFNLESQKM